MKDKIFSNYSEEKIKNIVKKAKSYNKEAFAQIYEIYHDPIYKYIFYRTGDNEITNDLTHDVFHKILKNIKNYKLGDVPFSVWVFKISKNILINFYKHKEIENKHGYLLSEHLITKNDSKNHDINRYLVDAINKLKLEERRVIIYKFISDLSNKETADILGKSIGAIKSIQYRAIKKLNKILIKKDYYDK